MKNPRLQTLIDTIQLTQQLLVFYVSKLKDTNPTKVFAIEGQELNSLYWLVGHLAWAENMLILEGTSGQSTNYPWLDNFKIGTGHQIDEKVSFSELKEGAKDIHTKAMAHLTSLNDEDLDKENAIKFGFGQDPSNQVVIMHFIRHLGTHIGHLSWLCKLHGIKAV